MKHSRNSDVKTINRRLCRIGCNGRRRTLRRNGYLKQVRKCPLNVAIPVCLLCYCSLKLKFINTLQKIAPSYGTRSWMRHCATSRKGAGSIPDGVNEIFHWLNASSLIMALGFDSASNGNEYQRSSLGGKGGQCVGLTKLPSSCADFLELLGTSTSWTPMGLSRDSFTYLFYC